MYEQYETIRAGKAKSDAAVTPGIYLVTNIGRTEASRFYSKGFRVQTWRRVLNNYNELGPTVYVIRTFGYTARANGAAVMFFSNVVEPDGSPRWMFSVFDELEDDFVISASNTQEFAVEAKHLWDWGVVPVISSFVDSVITS